MSEYNSSSFVSYPFLLTANIQFWCILTVLIPAIICSLFTLYHLLFDRSLRNTLNNHIIIVVLLVSLLPQITTYPWMLYYYRFEGVWERSPVFCSIWAYISWTFYILQSILFAWATIERHILIFYYHWVATKKKQFFFHYLPMFILIAYCLTYYVIVDFFPPCENAFANEYMTCASFCVTNNYYFTMWDTIAHQLVPGLIILVFSIALLVRIIWKKSHMHQPIQWHKHKKMAIQLLSISSVYILLYFPYIFVNSMLFLGYLNNINLDLLMIIAFLTYFMILVLPFVCMMTLPDLGKRMKKIVRIRRPVRSIGPTTRGVSRVAEPPPPLRLK